VPCASCSRKETPYERVELRNDERKTALVIFVDRARLKAHGVTAAQFESDMEVTMALVLNEIPVEEAKGMKLSREALDEILTSGWVEEHEVLPDGSLRKKRELRLGKPAGGGDAIPVATPADPVFATEEQKEFVHVLKSFAPGTPAAVVAHRVLGVSRA
jgi:hypothetical protein